MFLVLTDLTLLTDEHLKCLISSENWDLHPTLLGGLLWGTAAGTCFWQVPSFQMSLLLMTGLHPVTGSPRPLPHSHMTPSLPTSLAPCLLTSSRHRLATSPVGLPSASSPPPKPHLLSLTHQSVHSAFQTHHQSETELLITQMAPVALYFSFSLPSPHI